MKDFLKQYQDWSIPKDLEHPRLFFSPKDIPKLAEKAKICPQIWDPIFERCQGYLKASTPLRRAMQELSLVYTITGDTLYADKAKEMLRQMMSRESWVYPFHTDQGKLLRVDLEAAEDARESAFAYDCLFDYLSAEERDWLRNELLNRVVNPFLEIHSEGSEWWAKCTHNWRSGVCGKIGIAALSFIEDYPDVKACVEESLKGVLVVLDRCGVDGGWDEGVGYYGGVANAINFAYVLKRISSGTVDLFQHPSLKVTGDFGLYCATPDGGSFDFSDGSYKLPASWFIACLAREQQNPYWQWQVEKAFPNDMYGFLYYDPELKGKRPRDLPTAKLFRGIHVAVLRSGWEDDDVFIGFKSGRSTANHSHLDINSFMLSANRRRLAKDLGGWYYAHDIGFFETSGPRWDFEANSTLGHNTILVDGKGQRYGQEHYGKIVKFETSKEYDYLISDGSTAYGELLNKFLRYLVFVKPNLVFVLDDIEAEKKRRLEWLLHPVGKAVEADNGDITIRSDIAALDVAFLRPGKDEPRIITRRESKTTYFKRNKVEDSGEKCCLTNSYISVSPLHKQSKYQFIAVLNPYATAHKYVRGWKVEIEEHTAEKVKISATIEERELAISFDLTKQNIHLE